MIIQHLDPNHTSIIKDLIAKETTMPVTEVTEGTQISPNHIYVIPPNRLMTIDDHVLKLTPRDTSRGGHMPIDHFMRAMAEALGSRAIGVILSGTGSDGVLGMAEIQARGGVTFAQDPSTARYDGMPRAAIGAGSVDHILTPEKIGTELARLANHPYVSPRASETPISIQSNGAGINTIFQLLRRATGVDFTYYRKTTILRRIQRRMIVHKIDKFSDYVAYLQSKPQEIKSLYQDMLIHVTSFFRNPAVFDALKQNVFPTILKKKGADIRVWVPGCASGEETYSLAIALLEFLGPRAQDCPIQLFGTDISENSIKAARAGIYPPNVQEDVSSQRIRRFFTKIDGAYRINKSIREMCIFAQHNLLSDPPFSRMDLICCRNLLIYFEPLLQTRVISLFHYALRPGGFLVLGASEGTTSATHLFNIEDRENKIFSKKASVTRQVVTFSMNRHAEQATDDLGSPPRVLRAEPGWNYVESQRDFDRRLLAHSVPPTVFVNEDFEVVHSRGKIHRYFKVPAGRPTFNILRMAHDDLSLDLQNALGRAKKEKRPIVRKGIVLRSASERKGGAEHEQTVGFEVVPIKSGGSETYFMIVIHEDQSGEGAGKPAKGSKKQIPHDSKANRRLEHELATMKEHLQSVVENQEATNEELQSANEEILSSNEELQSTNEELETAKEELQSTNEELSTVNDELRSRNLEIAKGQRDLKDLLKGVNIALVGSDFKIRDFSPSAQRLLSLLPEEIGNPILESDGTGDVQDFQQLIEQAISQREGAEKEVMDRSGRRYRFRVLPFKANGSQSEGFVVTLVESSLANSLMGQPPGSQTKEAGEAK